MNNKTYSDEIVKKVLDCLGIIEEPNITSIESIIEVKNALGVSADKISELNNQLKKLTTEQQYNYYMRKFFTDGVDFENDTCLDTITHAIDFAQTFSDAEHIGGYLPREVNHNNERLQHIRLTLTEIMFQFSATLDNYLETYKFCYDFLPDAANQAFDTAIKLAYTTPQYITYRSSPRKQLSTFEATKYGLKTCLESAKSTKHKNIVYVALAELFLNDVGKEEQTKG